MTYTVGKLGPRQFFEPGFDVSIYFDLGARIFSTQRPPNVAHFLQGLLCDDQVHEGIVEKNKLICGLMVRNRRRESADAYKACTCLPGSNNGRIPRPHPSIVEGRPAVLSAEQLVVRQQPNQTTESYAASPSEPET